MKVEKPSKPLPAALTGKSAAYASSKGVSAPPPAAQQAGDTSVSLDSTATQLRSLESSMANTPVVNAAKVAEIKQAIADGRFKVNPEAVADRLLETVRGLTSTKA